MGKIKLGAQARDIITGFKGTVVGRVKYISGCNQLLLSPKVKEDGSSQDAVWFDEQRVEQIDGEVIVLDNTQTPGCDKPAPGRR